MFAQTSRRDLLKLGAGAAACSTLTGAADLHYIKGQVRCSLTHKGLPGIRISNGRNIVRTNDQGNYAIAASKDDIIFVVKPRNMAAALDERNLPKIHTKAGADTYDFVLTPVREDDQFNVLLIADPQPSNPQELSYLSEILAQTTQHKTPNFVLTLGDLIGDQPQLYDAYDRLMAQLGLPIWNIPGNHDLDFTTSSPTEARAFWRHKYGPGTHAFEYGPAMFICLDNIGHGASKGSYYDYMGHVGADNLRFVESLLRDVPKDQLIILAMHIPLISSEPKNTLACHTHDHQALLALLEGRPCISLSGHMHHYEHHEITTPLSTKHQHHVLNAICGSWWTGPYDPAGQPVAQSCDGTPNGWYILVVDGNQAHLKFQAARGSSSLRVMLGSENGQDCTLLPQRISCALLPQAKLFANVFSGGAHTRVSFRLAGGQPQWMSRSRAIDPSTQALFQAAGSSRKPWAEPVVSTHLWSAPLPMDLPAGQHRIDVEVFEHDHAVARTAYFLETTVGS